MGLHTPTGRQTIIQHTETSNGNFESNLVYVHTMHYRLNITVKRLARCWKSACAARRCETFREVSTVRLSQPRHPAPPLPSTL